MKIFLTAKWRDLALLNWRVQREVLAPFVPMGTELDNWNGAFYVSLVGFRFLDTRVLGMPVPLHTSFDEVNLRMYVRREIGNEVHRGVCFLQELVSRPVIAASARLTFNEPYRVVEMDEHIVPRGAGEPPSSVEYRWKWSEEWCGFIIKPKGSPSLPGPSSEEEFITDKPWGFTTQRDGGTLEYHVDHPRWRVWPIDDASVYGSVGESPEPKLSAVWSTIFGSTPHSVFFAEGSTITIYSPERIR
ncbi:MAG TPA: DUF2071 domain-containing protein [Gemmatimonadaceae bacterium]